MEISVETLPLFDGAGLGHIYFNVPTQSSIDKAYEEI